MVTHYGIICIHMHSNFNSGWLIWYEIMDTYIYECRHSGMEPNKEHIYKY